MMADRNYLQVSQGARMWNKVISVFGREAREEPFSFFFFFSFWIPQETKDFLGQAEAVQVIYTIHTSQKECIYLVQEFGQKTL